MQSNFTLHYESVIEIFAERSKQVKKSSVRHYWFYLKTGWSTFNSKRHPVEMVINHFYLLIIDNNFKDLKIDADFFLVIKFMLCEVNLVFIFTESLLKGLDLMF